MSPNTQQLSDGAGYGTIGVSNDSPVRSQSNAQTVEEISLLRIKQMYNIILRRNSDLIYSDNGYKDITAMSDSSEFNLSVIDLENECKKQEENTDYNFRMFDSLSREELGLFDEELTEVMLELEIPIDTVQMISSLNQGDYIITSNAGSVVAVGRTMTYKAVQIMPHFISADSKYHYRWYCENDVLTRQNYSSTASSVPEVVERDAFSNWFDETFGDPSDISFTATYPGVHDIKVDVYLDEKYLSTAIFRQTVLEGDPEIIAMSYNEKLLEVVKRCSFFDAMFRELGGWEGIIKLVAMMIGCAAVLAALAATGYGLAAEIIAGILAALFLGISVSKVIHGIYKIVEAMELTRVAASEAALDDAAKIFEEASAEVIINGIFAILCYFGAKGAKSSVQARIARGERVFVSTRVPLNNMAPGSPGHKAQRWLEYQLRNPDRYPNPTEIIEPRWSRLYDTIIQNSRAGRGFEGEALSRFNYTKNNHMFIEPGQNGGFIPDAIKGNPTEIIWGEPYHFVEVKGWQNLSNTGNLKSMLSYVKQNGGSIEVIIRSNTHSSGPTYMSEPLLRIISSLERSGKAEIIRIP